MGISADDVFAETMSPDLIAASDRRAKELLAEYETLQKLRKARALTQEHVARSLGKTQVTIAQLEKRSDFLLSTLREYVSALGGELDLVVRFEGHPPVKLAGIGADDPQDLRQPSKSSKGGLSRKRPAAA